MQFQTYQNRSRFDFDQVMNFIILAACTALLVVGLYRVGGVLTHAQEQDAPIVMLSETVQLDPRTPQEVLQEEADRRATAFQRSLDESPLNQRIERLYSRLTYPQDIALVMEDAARRHRIDPQLLLSVCVVESRLRPDVKSYAGAIGICQIIPKWHNTTAEAMYDYNQNVDRAAEHIAELIQMCKSDLSCAIQSYNAGHYGYKQGVRVPKYEQSVLAEYYRETAMK